MFSDSQIRHFMKIYVFANTVTYMFKKFRAEYSIVEVARNKTFSSISERIRTLLTNLDCIESLIESYALIVALSYMQGKSVIEFLTALKNDCTEWVPELSIYIMSQLNNDISAQYTIPSKKKDNIAIAASYSSNTIKRINNPSFTITKKEC